MRIQIFKELTAEALGERVCSGAHIDTGGVVNFRKCKEIFFCKHAKGMKVYHLKLFHPITDAVPLGPRC